MGITGLVEDLRQIGSCEVYPPRGLPAITSALPSDVKEFYDLAGGAMLFRGQDYSIEIVPPDRLVRANPIIAGDEGVNDISHDWYIVAQTGDQYITIDLAEPRFGRCYDSFWDRHGIAGDCPIVAPTFESLLEQLIKNGGGYWYWLEESFKSLGDAYDE